MSQDSSNKLGIVILNWNSFAVTDQCLIGLEDCLPSGCTIVLVDNGSTDGSGEKLYQKHPQMKFISNRNNLGFAGGNNMGISWCLDNHFKYVMLLNNDTIIRYDVVSPMLDYLNSNEGVDVIQPKIYFAHNSKLIWNASAKYSAFAGISWTIGENRTDHEKYDILCKTDWVTGCCFVAGSNVWQNVGLLDERFFIYHEDVDWSLRARKKGYQLVYFPTVTISHIAGVSQKSKMKRKEGFLKPTFHLMNTRNQLFIILKHSSFYHLPSALIVFFVKVFVISLYFIGRRRFSKLLYLWKGVIEGFNLNSTDKYYQNY